MSMLPHEKPIEEYERTLAHLRKQHLENPIFAQEIADMEKKLSVLKQEIYSKLTPWERVQICRHPMRPHTIDYIEQAFDSFEELKGDRLSADDPALIGGFAELDGVKCVVIGQEKGADTESRVARNFGMLNPEGFRKALRLMQLADKFHLPIVSFLDTPGAYPGLEAEEKGQGWAIAENLRAMAQISTPMLTLVIGEGCSGGALGMGMGDVIGMLEHAYYTVISPEGCASILWKDASRKDHAAEVLKLNAEDLLERGIIDHILKEPLGGAHHDRDAMVQTVRQFILEQLQVLQKIPAPLLLEQRYQKYRKMGSLSIDTGEQKKEGSQ